MSGNAGSYSFRVRAEGFAEFVRDLQQVAGESAAAQRAIATLIQSSPQLASAMTAAAEATERAARAAVQQREAQAQAAAATAAVTTQVAVGAQGLQTLQDRTLAASRAVVGLQGALQMAGLGQFAAALGPVGTGLTTVASGMGSAAGFATRFGEAALSLSRYLPGIGVALGAIAVATIDWDAANDRVARSLQGLRGAMADSEAAQTAFERGIRGIIQALETAADRERRLAAESRERMIAQGAAELPTIEEQRNRARRRVEELRPIAEQVQLAREIGGPDTQIAGAAARRYVDWQRAVAELQRLQALVDQAEGALRDLGSIPYGQPGVVPEPALPTPPIPPQPTSGGRPSAISDDDYARRMGERVQRAVDEQARIEDRARERAAEAEQRALRQREEANRRVTDDIVRYGADAFADLVDRNGRGWQGMLDSFERTFVRLMARLGAEAVIRPIVEPVVSYLGLGSIGTSVGGSGSLASAGGGTGVLGSLSNLWSLGSNAYSAFAGGTTGIAGLVNGLGAGSGLFAAGGSFGSNAALYGGAMNSGAAMAGQTAAAPLFGSTTAMGFLGAAGLGYGAGSLLGSYLAGDSRARQTNAQIGAAAGGLSGAALGAMYGSAIGPWGTVLGALIGGLAGGGGGGLIGPGPKTNAYGYTLDVTNGQFGAAGLMTTGTGNGGAEAIQETQRLVAALNQVMQGAGVAALPMRRVINGWANSLDQSASLNDAFALARFSATDARLQTAVGNRAFGSPEELAQTIQAAQQLIAVLDGLGKPIASFKDQAEALWQSFEPSIATAGRLGFGVAELRAEQQRQQDALWAQRNETLAGITSSLRANQLRAMGLTTEADLMDFDRGAASAVKALREQLEALGVTAEESAAQVAVLENTQALQRQSLVATASVATPPDTTARDSEARQLLEALSFGGLGGLSGGARSAAARLALMEARQPLRDGATTTEMAEFSRVAAATLPVIRDVEGISSGYRDIVRLVSSTLREAAPSSDTASLSALIEAQTAGADQITEAVLRIPGAIAELRGEFSRLALRLDAIAAKAA